MAGPRGPALDRLIALMEQAAAGLDGRVAEEDSGDEQVGRLAQAFNRLLARMRDEAADRRDTEEVLRQSLALLRESQEVAQLGHYTLDVASGRWESSPVLDHIFGLDPDTHKDVQTWLELVHPEDRAGMADYFAGDVLRDRRPFNREYRIVRHCDGEERWVQGLGRLEIGDDGAPVRMLGIIQDITDRKLAEAEHQRLQDRLLQAQRMETVGRLAGGIAHDFNNMLTVILGYAELLKLELPTDSGAADDVAAIERAALHSKEITRQLLAFSRQQLHEPRPVDLNALVEDARKTLARLIGEDVELRFEVGPELWPALCDPAQVDQILVNLAANARDAMPMGGVLTFETTNIEVDAVRAGARSGARAGEYVRLTASDNGTGMDAETLAHIYEPFFTTKAIGRGTGLGLATVYGIVAQNGGFIEERSMLGEGTTFRVYLPRAAGRAERVGTPFSSPAVEPSRRAPRATILLVEDDPLVRRVTAEMLRENAYRVLPAEGPLEALALCQQVDAEIDLLLTDIVMPVMHGLELADEIALVKPGTRALFMTGYTSSEVVRRGFRGHDLRLIEKPFSQAELLSKVREALNQRSVAAE